MHVVEMYPCATWMCVGVGAGVRTGQALREVLSRKRRQGAYKQNIGIREVILEIFSGNRREKIIMRQNLV